MAGHQPQTPLYQPPPAEQYWYGGNPPAATPVPAHPAPAPRRKSRALRVFAVLSAVVVLAAVGMYVKRDAVTAWLSGWDGEQQVIADAFPNLFPASSSAAGWLGASCYSTSYMDGQVQAISCSNKDTGFRYQVRTFHSRAEADAYVYSGVHHRATDQVVTHPNVADPVTVTTAPATTGTYAPGTVYTRFPDDAQRNTMVFDLDWANHTAAETLEQWWPQAPLGKETEN